MADFFYDLAGADPIIKDLIYNNAADVDGDTLSYRGQFSKVLDHSDVGEGRHICSVTEGTATENIVGILMEQVAASGDTYLLSSAVTTENWTRKKILVNPHAVYLLEYTRKTAAGVACVDTGLVVAAGAIISTTSPQIGTDLDNAGWIYMLDGGAVNELHFMLQTADSATVGMEAFRTAAINAIAVGDTFLCINPPFDYAYKLNDTKTDLESEAIGASRTDRFIGIDYWMKAPGWPFQKLTASIHDGLIIQNARFFHEVAISNHYLGGTLTLS